MKSKISQDEIHHLEVDGLLAEPFSFRISDVEHLASYNWLERPEPTIVVPGLPPRWRHLRGVHSLPPDSGLVYINQNAARHPDYPLEPLFRALDIARPDFDVQDIDVVTDRNNLRKLFGFVAGRTSAQYPKEAFEIHVEVRGETLILCRTEKEPTEILRTFRGYGHEFEKKYTNDDIEGSTGHHRVVSYDFDGLQMLVRYEADGYVDDGASIDKALGKLNLAADHSAHAAGHYIDTKTTESQVPSKLRVLQGGYEVTSILEIKTRAAHKAIDLEDVSTQLWISQTHKLVRAYHNRGTFQQPEVEDVTNQVQKWETAHQLELRKLGWLLRRIGASARELGKATVKWDPVSHNLHIRQREGELLPAYLRQKWNETKGQESNKGDDNDEGGDAALSRGVEV